MIEIPFGRLKICFCFSFFAAVALLMLMSESRLTLLGLYACIIHELGHMTVMLFFGQSVKRIVFYGAGIKIVRGRNELLTDEKKEFAVLAAGCAVNFLAFAASGFIPRLHEFGQINLVIGLFNLLPLASLDGGKIIARLFYAVMSFERAQQAEKLLKAANVMLALFTAAAFYIAGAGNFSVYFTLLYLLAASI